MIWFILHTFGKASAKPDLLQNGVSKKTQYGWALNARLNKRAFL